MKFTALLSLLWDDDWNEDENVEFLEDLYACWWGSRVDDIGHS